ncbi:MAG TPA: choice-of-anchor B family protein [Bacteroidia bacterium]
MAKNLFIPVFIFVTLIVRSQNFNVVHRGSLSYPGKECANICGYVDSTGKEYALVGVETGMSVVDVSDPDVPVEVIHIPWPAGPSQIWKEIKVYKQYAYVTSEAGSGLQICDLRQLPTSTVPYHHWEPVILGQTLSSIHSLHIDTTKNNVYLYGSNIGNGGAICASLADPWNPVYLGMYDPLYVHDGYVDNDTLYAGEIINGTCSIIDFTDKNNPVILTSFPTPGNFTHNTWPSFDKKTLFTTDEISNSYLTAYDITDLGNVTELDKIKTNPGSNSIVHNVHVRKDSFAVTSWYTEGFTIVDVTYPHNMIEVGKYDTYSGSLGDGFHGAWGVYPFLPSGTIVVSNIEDGLHVLTPTYIHACWLEGNVQDSVTLANLNGVQVQIVSQTQANTTTANGGNYATGTVNGGTYSIQLSKSGYQTLVVNNVTLTNGVRTILNRKLLPNGVGVHTYSNDATNFVVGKNPFADEAIVYYSLKSDIESHTLHVVDNLGKLSEQYTISGTGEIAIGNSLEAGVYYVSIDGGKPVRILKTN